MSEGQVNKTSKSESETQKDSESENSRHPMSASERAAFGFVDCPWWSLHLVAFGLGVTGLILVILPTRKHDDEIFPHVFPVSAIVYQILLSIWYLFYLNEPDKCLGKVSKSIIEVITVTAAVAIRQFLGYKIAYLISLVGSTAHFHAILQFRRVAYDISIWDVLLGSLMQIVVYLMGGHVYLLTVGLVLCGGVIFYRAITYSSPIVLVQEQEKMQQC